MNTDYKVIIKIRVGGSSWGTIKDENKGWNVAKNGWHLTMKVWITPWGLAEASVAAQTPPNPLESRSGHSPHDPCPASCPRWRISMTDVTRPITLPAWLTYVFPFRPTSEGLWQPPGTRLERMFVKLFVCKPTKPLACQIFTTAGLLISYKVGLLHTAVITRSDFKSEAIFWFPSPNYTCECTWFFS